MAVQISVINATLEADRIYHQPANAMLTTFGPGPYWDVPIGDGYKKALLRSYAPEIKAASPLKDGQVLVAHGDVNVAPKFGRAVFVFDAFQSPLDQLVGAGLRRAEELKMTTIVMPLLRTSRRFRSEDSLSALARGVAIFADHASSVKAINIVVNDNAKIAEALEEKFSRAQVIDQQNRPGYRVDV